MVSVPLRIGLFGGTFDPPHVGHIAAAVNVRHALGLDRVLMMVASDPYQKSAVRTVTPADARLEMTRAACAGVPGLEVSDAEIVRGGQTFTFDTVRDILSSAPDTDIFVIVGGDTAARVESWHRWHELAEIVHFVVIARSDDELSLPRSIDWIRVDTPVIECSSTDLRRRLSDGKDTNHLLPRSVLDVIHARHLYVDDSRRQPLTANTAS